MFFFFTIPRMSRIWRNYLNLTDKFMWFLPPRSARAEASAKKQRLWPMATSSIRSSPPTNSSQRGRAFLQWGCSRFGCWHFCMVSKRGNSCGCWSCSFRNMKFSPWSVFVYASFDVQDMLWFTTEKEDYTYEIRIYYIPLNRNSLTLKKFFLYVLYFYRNP